MLPIGFLFDFTAVKVVDLLLGLDQSFPLKINDIFSLNTQYSTINTNQYYDEYYYYEI